MTQTGFIPPPFVPAPAAAAASARPAPQHTNVKETIESILVAFILAFIFRAFVVEAFVIPTGSMAPTLLGAHSRFYCPDCGYQFDVNYSNPPGEGDDAPVPAFNRVHVGNGKYDDRVLHVRCPNCGYKLPQPERRTAPPDDNDAAGPPIHYGDRILVLKYLYLFEQPKRWDVVVFKSPQDPEKYDYTQNYIKRLVGGPNEAVLILDGDIYTAEPQADPSAYKIEDFRVQRKSDVAQDALWRIVYDNDFRPRGLTGGDRAWQQPWQPAGGAGWDLTAGAGGRVFAFDNPTGAGRVAFNPDAYTIGNPNGPTPAFARSSGTTSTALTDWLAYDMTQNVDPNALNMYNSRLYPPQNNVSDVKLAFTYARSAGDGPLRASVTKLDDTFTAEVYPDKVRLLRARGNTPPAVVDERAMSVGGGPVRVELRNVDYEVSLWLDGRRVLRTTDYAPDAAALLAAFGAGTKAPRPNVALEAERQACTLQHVSLWRDIYYLNADGSILWASPAQFPARVATLGPDEYFVCGDNALISGDARMWKTPIHLPDEDLNVAPGRVPGRFMLGKAFFVYWPAGYRPLPGLPGLAPNFGDMRFIH